MNILQIHALVHGHGCSFLLVGGSQKPSKLLIIGVSWLSIHVRKLTLTDLVTAYI